MLDYTINDRIYVISNYDFNYFYLIKDSNHYVIYDQSIEKLIPDSNSNIRYVKSNHSGHNITDILDFIIENYSSLPSLIYLLKGNVVPKFIKFENMEYFLELQQFSSIFEIERTVKNLRWYKKKKNLIKEKNNSWYLEFKKGLYFKSYNEFLAHFFEIKQFPKYITFSPGVSLCVERERIYFYPKEFYQKLQSLIKDEFFPGEAYILERAMYFMFEKKRKINYAVLDHDFVKII